MADYFISIPFRQPANGNVDTTDVTIATSTTSASYLEFRWTTGVGVTRKDIFDFWEGTLVKLLREGGKDRLGTGVPPT